MTVSMTLVTGEELGALLGYAYELLRKRLLFLLQ